ncbi:MAG: 50S ribosomal protein L11 methyltransferase [Clostridia bacterium]|nr:50S ribosomal protein L11 methyltransferase [Clostridia bacterium]
MDYTKVTVYTNSDGIDLVSAALYDLGIVGLQIMDKKDFEDFMKQNLRAWDIVDEELMSSMMSQETQISFYLENDEKKDATVAEVIKTAKKLSEEGAFGRMKVEESLVKEEDWANNWKKYYKPLRIGEHIVIKPTWENAELEANDVVVELDPGMAFGTGSHASTHMCLEFLEKTIQKGDKVLDIGTGSGILGIAALKLGAKSVTAVDIDPLAVKIAKENAALNGFEEPEFTVFEGDLADKVTGEYDVVIANIVADIICELSKNVGKYIKADGKFITSGIIEFKADNVRNALKENGIIIREEKNKKDWNSFLCDKA